VALSAAGQPIIQPAPELSGSARTIVFCAFDLLMLSGANLMDWSLDQRR
jgi:ATP-dependent DNA ligase